MGNDQGKRSKPELPAGTVTFLFTDIEGSTQLLQQMGEEYVDLLADHHRILRQVFARWQGTEVDTEGDAFFVSFPRATDAVSAVIEAQRLLIQHEWSRAAKVKVRMGLHTGEPWTASEGYVGMDVHRAARIAHIGHGGQVLLSETTAALIRSNLPDGVELLDLGYHRLKDMVHPEHIRQLEIEGLPAEFPPLKSLGIVAAPQPLAMEPPELPAFLDDGAAGPERPVFVGRERQLAWLDNRLQTLLNGKATGNVVFVAGEAGMGKTSLLQALTDKATEAIPDLLVAWGVCNAFIGPGDAYLPFRQALDMLSGDVEGAWRAGIISAEQARRLWDAYPAFGEAAVEHGRAVTSTLVNGRGLLHRARDSFPQGTPWLSRLEGMVEPAEGSRDDLSRDKIHQSCSELLSTIARQRPILLLLDDLQWADSASLNLLFHLGRGLSSNPVLIVGAYRPEDVALGRDDAKHPLEGVLAELRRLSGEVILDLRKTEVDEQRAFVDELLDSEPNALDGEFRQTLFVHTGGQPLFTVEMLRYLQDRGDLVLSDDGDWTVGKALDWSDLPDRVEGVIEARIGRLEDELRELLNVAAVEGENFTAQVLARVQAFNERRLLRTLSRQLEKKHQLIRERSALKQGQRLLYRYRFAHALFQQYLYNDLSLGERRMLHAEIAAILKELYAGRTDEICVMLARHYLKAGEDDRALEYLLRSGDQARDIHALEEAVWHYEAALEILRRQGDHEAAYQILMKLGQSYHGAFEYERAGEVYREAFRHFDLSRKDVTSRHLSSRAATVRWAILPKPFITLDYTGTNDFHDWFFIGHLFSGLLQLSPQLDVLPDIATSWKISDDGLTYQFHLRDDVVWSDGQPVTAHDFDCAWRHILDPGRSSPVVDYFTDVKGVTEFRKGRSDYLGIEVPDAWTIRIILERPSGYFLHLLAVKALPVPKHAVETYGEKWSDPANLVTNGPFLLEKLPETWRVGESLIIKRNPRYHGAFPGNVEQVDMLVLEDEGALEAYEQNKIDICGLGGLSASEYRRALQLYAAERLTYPGHLTIAIIFDTGHPPFDDVRVRRAFALASDRRELADERTVVAQGGFIPPGLPGHMPDIALPYDLEGARRLLAEAGFPGGHRFPEIRGFVYCARSYLVEHFNRFWVDGLGVQVRWELGNTFDASQNYHLSCRGWAANYPDPDNLMRIALRSLSNWKDPIYDDLIGRANRILDYQQRMRLFRQAEEILVTEAPLFPLFYGKGQWLMKPWIKNPLPIYFNQVPTHHYIIEPH